ncbi:helix-turn-helix domain-containing protein, partial [Microbispora rosea]
MGRWEPNARGRLAKAALELYVERGYEQTTVAEIAKRAGLTERTFFRHFADKREVLFSGSDALRPAGRGPWPRSPRRGRGHRGPCTPWRA